MGFTFDSLATLHFSRCTLWNTRDAHLLQYYFLYSPAFPHWFEIKFLSYIRRPFLDFYFIELVCLFVFQYHNAFNTWGNIVYIECHSTGSPSCFSSTVFSCSCFPFCTKFKNQLIYCWCLNIGISICVVIKLNQGELMFLLLGFHVQEHNMPIYLFKLGERGCCGGVLCFLLIDGGIYH